MVKPRRLGAPLLLSSMLALTGTSAAQEGDASRAEKLFIQGREARDKGDHAAACAKFAESLRLVKRASTLVNLATCEEKLGKLSSSIGHAKEALAMMPPGDERLQVAKDVLDRAGRRAARVTLVLPPDAPPDARVRVDGAELDRGALAAPLTLDPGEHAVVVLAAGRVDATTNVTLAEGQRGEVALATGTAAVPPEKAGATAVAARRVPEPDRPAPAGGGGSSRRTLGFIVGGVGVAGLAAAGVTGGILLANDGTITESCPNNLCDQDGLDAIDRQKTLIVVNYIAWGAGIVGVGAGGLLILTSPSGESQRAASSVVSPWAGPHGAGLSFSRSF